MFDWLFGRKKDESEEKPKKKKPQAEQEAEDKWKYDFIVQFLSGPLWKTSILDFVDYHCVVFDNEEENKFEYTTIHNKFKEMVGGLFDGMMEEVGLDNEQLAYLLEKGFESKQRKIFAQLLLVDDFLKFKTLMVNRNKALEAEAMKALQESQHPEVAHSKHHHKGVSQEQMALQQSIIAEKERQKKIQQQEEEQLRKVLEMSKIEAQQAAMIKKLEEKAAQKEAVKPQPEPVSAQNDPKPGSYDPINIEQQSKPAVVDSQASSAEIAMPVPRRNRRNIAPMQPLPPVKGSHKKHEQSPKQQFEEKPVIQQPKKEPIPEPILEEKPVVVQKPVQPKQNEQSQEDRKKRLMEQRERIRRKKEEERKKQMAEDEAKPTQVQTIVLQEDGIHETNIGAPVEEKKVSNTQIERRRELMKKIKNRIIDDL